MESAPRVKMQQRRPAVAPLNICIYKVTDKAGDVWSVFENSPSAKLWQIQLDHNAHSSILFQLWNSFEDFLGEKSSNNENYPKNKDELLHGGGATLVFSNNKRPENVGTRATENGDFR